MARVELKNAWTVSGDVESVQIALRKFLNRQKMRVVDESDGEIRFAQGSQFLTRFLGGWFVKHAWLPKSGSLETKQTKSGVRIKAIIEESLGFGFLDPLLESKYQQFFEQWMEDLESTFD